MVAYGSNPLTNGNGGAAGGTPGNHTPQDIWVGAEDNTGSHAQMIAGRGLLDNTALTPIMGDFLRLNEFVENLGPSYRRSAQPAEERVNVYPMPFEKELTVEFRVETPSRVSVEIVDGAKIKTLVGGTPGSTACGSTAGRCGRGCALRWSPLTARQFPASCSSCNNEFW